MPRDSKYQDPRTWVKLPSGKPLMKAIPKRNLKSILNARGLSVASFAKAFGTSEESVHSWISGRVSMSNENVVRVALFLKVSPLFVLDLTKQEFTKHNAQLSVNELQTTAKNRMLGYQGMREKIDDCLRQDWSTGPEGFYRWDVAYDPLEMTIAPEGEDELERLYATLDEEHLARYGGDVYQPEEYLDEDWRDWLLSIPGDYRDLGKLASKCFSICMGEEPSITQAITLIETCRAVAGNTP